MTTLDVVMLVKDQRQVGSVQTLSAQNVEIVWLKVLKNVKDWIQDVQIVW